MSLTDSQKKFIQHYIATGKPRASAIAAGYAPKSASKTAASMLKENKAVMAEIERIRGGGKALEEYDLKAAMAEANEAIEIARSTDNAASFLAAVKLKAQLMKILDDKPAGAAFQINISGIGGDEQKTVISVIQPSIHSLTGGGDGENG